MLFDKMNTTIDFNNVNINKMDHLLVPSRAMSININKNDDDNNSSSSAVADDMNSMFTKVS
jgi:archaellum component FlaF (FlaF/FlaG flagellin family)